MPGAVGVVCLKRGQIVAILPKFCAREPEKEKAGSPPQRTTGKTGLSTKAQPELTILSGVRLGDITLGIKFYRRRTLLSS